MQHYTYSIMLYIYCLRTLQIYFLITDGSIHASEEGIGNMKNKQLTEFWSPALFCGGIIFTNTVYNNWASWFPAPIDDKGTVAGTPAMVP